MKPVMETETGFGDPEKASRRFGIDQPAYTQNEFNKAFDYNADPPPACFDEVKSCLQYEFSKDRIQRGIKSRFPFIDIMKEYNWRVDTVSDVIAGVTVGIMHIPQGMAYAMTGHLDPVLGLYTSFFPVIIYFFLGTSRHISQGTFAVITLMFAKSVVTLSGADIAGGPGANMTMNGSAWSTPGPIADRYYSPTEVATAICLLVGLLQLIMGFCRLGALTVFLSDTLISGFTTGAAVTVLASIFDTFFGLKAPHHTAPLDVINTFIFVFAHIAESNYITVLISIGSIVALAGTAEIINPSLKGRCPVPLPIELIVVILGTFLSWQFHLNEDYAVDIVGNIPVGFPTPKIPPVNIFKHVFTDSIAIAIVSYAVSLSVAKIFAKKHNYDINANQELIAMGAANFISSFLSCFPMCIALSRSLVNESVGGKTQLFSLVSSSLVLVVLLVLGKYFKTLPMCVLSAIIAVAIRGMFLQVRDLKRAWYISKLEGLIWLVTFLSVVLIAVDTGLMIGVIFSIATVIWRSQRPNACILGLVPDARLYLDINRYKTAIEEPGIKIFHFGSPIYFANAKFFRKEMYRLVGINPRVLARQLEKKKIKEFAENVNDEKLKRKDEVRAEKNAKFVARFEGHPDKADVPVLVVERRNGNVSAAASPTNKEPENQMEANATRATANCVITTKNANQLGGFANNGFVVDNAEDKQAGQAALSFKDSAVDLSMVSSDSDSHTRHVANGLDVPGARNETLAETGHFRGLAVGQTELRHIVIDFSAVGFVDVSAVNTILQLMEEYGRVNISLHIAACPDAVTWQIRSCGFYERAPEANLYPTIRDAVLKAQTSGCNNREV